jgi:methionyl aminopeptidase
MIKLKNKQQIKIMREGGKILALVLDQVIKSISPGAKTEELNELAERLIGEYGARPSFKGYQASWSGTPFPSALCVSVNNEVVHGLPIPSRTLAEGDIVGLDCGLEYKGLYTDMARTVGVGKISAQAKKLIKVTEECLMLGIKQAKAGNYLLDIGQAISEHAKKNGFSVVKQLVGHGVGFSAHEEPQIPNYPEPHAAKIKIEPGMTLAIEPMINLGDYLVETLDDGWTIVTADGSLSAHFEHTIAVTEKGVEIITK